MQSHTEPVHAIRPDVSWHVVKSRLGIDVSFISPVPVAVDEFFVEHSKLGVFALTLIQFMTFLLAPSKALN